jgi:FixJ family two-component response regulator
MVLIVAPDQMVRRSLEFVIEAEGVTVDSHALLVSAVHSPFATNASCTIVDEDAVQSARSAWNHFPQLPQPIILLVERPERHVRLSRSMPIHILTKPIQGNLLIETLQHLDVGI